MAFDDWYTDLEVVHGGAFAFPQCNCCFHILDSVAVVDSDNDAFAAQQSVVVQLLELTNAVGYTKPRTLEEAEAAPGSYPAASCLLSS